MNLDVMMEAFAVRLLPMFNEVAISAIHHFHPEQYPQHAVLAAVGALVASAVLYFIGVWLRRMPEKVSKPEQQARIEGMRGTAQHWLPWLLILSPTPLGCVLIMAAGFFRIRPFVAAAAIIAAEVLWRISPVLSANG